MDVVYRLLRSMFTAKFTEFMKSLFSSLRKIYHTGCHWHMAYGR